MTKLTRLDKQALHEAISKAIEKQNLYGTSFYIKVNRDGSIDIDVKALMI